MRLAKGEADKTIAVKKAEAEAESKRLQGEGIAAQRKAIIAGLKESVEDFQKVVEGATAKDVMILVLLTQYFDTLKDIGSSGHSNTILMPHSPGASKTSSIKSATRSCWGKLSLQRIPREQRRILRELSRGDW